MSAAAVKIINSLRAKSKDDKENMYLGTIKSASPLVLQLDDVGFEISRGLLVNSDYQEKGIAGGDRVLAIGISNSCYIVLCKLVSA